MDKNHLPKTRLGIRLSEQDYAEIKSCAELAGVSLSEYIRRSALRNDKRPVIIADAETLKQIHTSLRRAGSNVNQIARALNTKHGNDWALDDLSSALKNLELASADVSAFITEIRNSI